VDICRSLDFRPEQETESTVRPLQEPLEIFKGLTKISEMMLVVKQNEIN